MTKSTHKVSLVLVLIAIHACTGCMPELPSDTNNDTQQPPGDTTDGTIILRDGVAEACKDADFPTNCKSTGVCNVNDEDTGLPAVWKCDEEKKKWVCDYSGIEGYEKKETLCDNLDNDCDGDKDETDDVTFEAACPDMNAGVCAVAPGAVVITCVVLGNPPTGTFECDASGVSDYAPAEFFDPQAEEPGLLCDGLDNDCDGQTDEDHEFDGGFAPSELGNFFKCQGFNELCEVQVTNEDPYEISGEVLFRCNGGSMECSYEHVTGFEPVESLCDGVDNDCDGETDEVTDIDASTCPHQGVCEGKVSALCYNEKWLCDMTAVLNHPDFQIEETRCDGLDNDCDGETDEGMDYVSILEKWGCTADNCDDPFCAQRHPECTGEPLTFDVKDRCPKGDNVGGFWIPDMNVMGWPILPGVCGYDPITGITNVLLECVAYDSDGDKVNDTALFACRYEPMEMAVDPIYTESENLFTEDGHWCDNLDNDCDGLVDAHLEGYTSVYPIEVTESNPEDLLKTTCHALGECATGATALCVNGAWDCTYGGAIEVGTEGSCVNNPDAPDCIWAETACDGLDNDCDGTVDEAITSAEETALTAAGCTQEGVCDDAVQAVCNWKGQAPGTWSCDYSAAFLLGYHELEDGDPTLCDALDNDCDGQIDENISAGPLDPDYALIIEAAGCLFEGVCLDKVEATCNLNLGAPGVWDCNYDNVDFHGGVEVDGVLWENLCDGLDNDCDGVIDENLNQDFGGEGLSPKDISGCHFSGICDGTMQWDCNSAGEWTCLGDPAVGWEPEEASCDDVDNDCDGFTDEGLADAGPAGADCPGHGTGVCETGLSASCQNGVWSCHYDGVANYEATEVSCDGLDNDCDGEATDEENLNWLISPGMNACKSQGVCDPEKVEAICSESSNGWTCVYTAVPDYKAHETEGDCDGLDNDCDGLVDEQACGACQPCTEDNNCFNNLCRPDPFGGETYCASGETSCVMEHLGTGECMPVLNGQVACITSTARAICMQGQWNVEGMSDCSGALPACHDGLCKTCSPQALSCDGTTVLQCDESGDSLYELDTCPAGQICVGAGQCVTNNEFQVNDLLAYSTTFAPKPRVAGLKGGGFVVVWGSNHPTADGSGSAIMAQIYGDDLQPLVPDAPPFVVNEILENNQSEPAVCSVPVGHGRFAVAWATDDTPGDPDQGIALRIFEADGTPVSGEIPVNQNTALNQSNPAVTMHTDGRIFVTWDLEFDDTANPYDVQGRYFLADGTPEEDEDGKADEFTLNTILSSSQRTPDAAFLPDSGLATAWSSLGKDGSGFAVVAKTLDDDGYVALDEMLVNEYTFNSQKNQVVVALGGDKAGWFAVFWESQKQASGDSSGIFIELFDQWGTEVGQGIDIQVHQNDAGMQSVPRAALLKDNDLVVVWESEDIDANATGISRRIFNASGGPETSELPVNQSVAGAQADPDVDAIDPTTFVVVWTNENTGHIMGRVLND